MSAELQRGDIDRPVGVGMIIVVSPDRGWAHDAHLPALRTNPAFAGTRRETAETVAVASVHYRGGSSRGTNLLWEINSTEGDLVVTTTGSVGSIRLGGLQLAGARGNETLHELAPPEGRVPAGAVPPVATGVATATTSRVAGNT